MKITYIIYKEHDYTYAWTSRRLRKEAIDKLVELYKNLKKSDNDKITLDELKNYILQINSGNTKTPCPNNLSALHSDNVSFQEALKKLNDSEKAIDEQNKQNKQEDILDPKIFYQMLFGLFISIICKSSNFI